MRASASAGADFFIYSSGAYFIRTELTDNSHPLGLRRAQLEFSTLAEA